MKRVIALLLCLVMVVCCVAACGNDTPDEVHSHTYSETWSSDAVGHWYMATCECEDVEEKKFSHADKNDDGACDVCEYKIACADGHTYAEGWTVDCTNHWHAADCGHIVPGTNIEAHTDDDNDGECDVCKYVIEDIHTHYYDTEWTVDDQYHWHAALCEHAVEVADKAAHVLNAAGYCTVCDTKVQDVDVTDIGAVLAAAAARNDKVTGGNVEYVNTIPDINIVQTHSVYFVLGTDSTYIKRTQYGAATEFWYEYISEDEVFGVTSYDGGLTLTPVSVGNDDLNGYIYMPSTIADASTLDGILSALYELSKADTAKDVAVDYDAETGVYSFSYEYLAVNVVSGNESMNDSGDDDSTAGSVTNVDTRLFTVEVQFEIDDNLVISATEFVVGAYNQDIDGDYVYNVEDGTYTMSAGALADTYAYKVAQSSGDRQYSTAYPKASIVPHDFDLLLPNGEVAEDEIKVSAGTYVQLTLANLVPFSAQVSCINPDDMSIVIANKANPDDTLYAYYWNGSIGFYPSVAGEYSVTITYEDVVKNYDLIVSPASPTSVGMYGFEWIQGYDQLVYTADVTNPGPTSMIVLEPGETFDFAVLCSPNAADQGVTVTVDSADATISSVTLTDVVVFYEILDTYTAYQFKSDVVGTYNITITSTADSNITKTVTAYVGTEPGGDEQNSTTLNFNTPGNFANTSQVFTAPVAGTYVITAEGLDATTWLQIDRYDPVNDTDWTKIHTQLPYSIELAEGEELTVRLYGWSNDTAIVGTPVAVTLALELAESTGTVIKLETPGNFANVSSVFTAPAAGTYVITAEGLDATTWLQIDRYDPVNDTDWTKIHTQLPYSIELAEGEELTVRLYGWSNDAAIVGTEVSITIALGDSGNDDSGDSGEGGNTEAALVVGTNQVAIDQADIDGGYKYLNFTVTEEGNYSFSIADVSISIYDSNEMYVGYNSALLAPGTYELEIGAWGLTVGTVDLIISFKEVQTLTTTAPTTLEVADGDVDGQFAYQFVTGAAGLYTISATGADNVYINVKAADGTYPAYYEVNSAIISLEADSTYTVIFIPVAAGSYTLAASSLKITDLTVEQFLGMTVGKYLYLADYNVYISDNEDGTYFNVYDNSTFDCYYTFVTTANGDGTFNIVLTYVVTGNYGESASDVLGLNGATVVATYNEGWVLTSSAISEGGDNEGGEDSVITGTGAEEDPYVITGASSMMISADYYMPIFVKVSAGVTATLDCAAQFYTDPADLASAVGTSVTPTEDTVYAIYADTRAGAMGQITATVGGSGETGGDSGNTDSDISYTTTLADGDNTIYFSADEIAAGSATRKLTVSADGSYKFEGSVFVSSITDSQGNTITRDSTNLTYALVAGEEYTVTFGMFSALGVDADEAYTVAVTSV